MKWSKNLEDVVGGRLYGHISSAVEEAIESGCTFSDFKEILHTIIVEMIELGYMFDDYREFRHEIEAGIDIGHPKEEWDKMLDEASEGSASSNRN